MSIYCRLVCGKESFSIVWLFEWNVVMCFHLNFFKQSSANTIS